LKEIERIRRHQVNEINAHITKKQTVFSDFKKNRAVDLNNLLQKFKNRRNEIMQEQKTFLSMQMNMHKTKSMMAIPNTTKHASK